MKEIVKCSCGREEYYGMMHWINGKQVCRECAFENWEARETWQRGDKDYVYPLYQDGKDYRIREYYVSLVRGLYGYYVKFKAPNEIMVRKHLVKYFGRLWCSVYSPQEFESVKERYTTKIINEDDPILVMTEEDFE